MTDGRTCWRWSLPLIVLLAALSAGAAERVFRAGAAAVDVTPLKLPVIVNGGFTERTADQVHDPLYARAIVLDDGMVRLAIVVVDSCMMPRELLDEAKRLASEKTAIPVERMLISATHTHSAPSAMGCLGSDADLEYQRFLPGRIALAIEKASARLAPARIGWAVIDDFEHAHCRRWIFRPDRLRQDPFGELTVRATMHPGYMSPDAVGPSGPADPGLSVLSIQSPDGRPMALLANYSMHYFSSPALSADYFGVFARKIGELIGADADSFVGILSQGTSGDIWLADYSKAQPQRRPTIDEYASAVARSAHEAYKTIEYHDFFPLAMREAKLTLGRRTPDPQRLAWAKQVVAGLDGRKPRTQPEIYAREQVFLHQEPQRELKLQAVRIGELGITAIPNEVYAITGLKLKARSPFLTTINISPANGSEGYIPPPEQHALGGYTTWPARTAALEAQAEPQIVETVLQLLEEVAGRPQRPIIESHGAYAESILAATPLAYWRLGEFNGPSASDSRPNQPGHAARFEDGVVFHLDGPQSPAFSGEGASNRTAHFAGGRMSASLPGLGGAYSVELWFWNGMPHEARPVTGYLFSRGRDSDPSADGDHLGIGGTFAASGRLFFFNGNERDQVLAGKTPLELKAWNHVVLVRDGRSVIVYLNGKPEISGQAEISIPPDVHQLFIGGRNDNFANFEGKIDEVAIYDRALTAAEAAEHFNASGMAHPIAPALQRDSEPKSPEEALAAMHVNPRFKVALVAAEPLVRDPVAIDWGPDGRLWVVEMADYPLGLDGKMKPGGRIKYLEDTNGDGAYDRSTLFLDGVNFPTGIIVWRSGVIISAAPEIFYAEDTDGDGKVDLRRTLFKGFQEGNPQLRINGLRFGLDNWLYCANGWSGGSIISEKTGARVDLGKRDVRIKPDEGLIELVSGVTQFGRNRDDWGQWFGTENSHPLFHYVLEDRYLRRNPHVAAPDPKRQLLTPANPPVFPRSRPQKRYHSFEHTGHFTSACSGMIYQDDLLFPLGAVQHAVVCEPVHNLVQHVLLTEDGVSFSASRADDERTSEILASEDPWFRPVMVRTGPDGALWVVDIYRYMIEHPHWLPEHGQAELRKVYRDGDDRGRIYRLIAKGQPPRPTPRLDRMNTRQLVDALDSSSAWQRDMAHRMLLWKQDHVAIVPLEELVASSSNPRARVHALSILDALGALRPDLLARAMADEHPGVRCHALRMAEPLALDHAQLIEAAVKLVNDPDAKVRLQLACTLGEWNDPRAGQALGRLAVANRDQTIFAAIMSSALKHYEPILSALLDPPYASTSVTGQPFQDLAAMALALDNRDALARLLRPILSPAAEGYTTEQFEAFARFLDMLAQRRMSAHKLATAERDGLSQLLGEAGPLFSSARQCVADSAASPPHRLAAARLLGRDPAHFDADLQRLLSLLAPQAPVELQTAAIRSIGRIPEASVPELLCRSWPAHSPAVRAAILDVLIPRDDWARQLLRKIETGAIAALDVDLPRRQRLLKHSSEDVRTLAGRLLGEESAASRQEVIEEHRSVLRLPANSARGEKVFALHCATCHRMNDVGQEIAPNLLSVSSWSAEALLAAILDPDRQLEPRYIGYSVTLNDDETLFGIILSETGNSISIAQLDGQRRTLLRADIRSMTSTNRSLMPVGFESAMSHQELADLIAFIQRPHEARPTDR